MLKVLGLIFWTGVFSGLTCSILAHVGGWIIAVIGMMFPEE